MPWPRYLQIKYLVEKETDGTETRDGISSKRRQLDSTAGDISLALTGSMDGPSASSGVATATTAHATAHRDAVGAGFDEDITTEGATVG